MAIQVKTRQWGNSIGIVIPNDAVELFNIKPDEDLIVEIKKKTNVLKELFGAVKFKHNPKETVQEARRALESKWG